jgi:hypothetical protein
MAPPIASACGLDGFLGQSLPVASALGTSGGCGIPLESTGAGTGAGTGTVQVQYRYSTGTVQVQCKYSTGTHVQPNTFITGRNMLAAVVTATFMLPPCLGSTVRVHTFSRTRSSHGATCWQR